MYSIDLNVFNHYINAYASTSNLSDEFINNAITLVSTLIAKDWFNALTDEEMWDAVLTKYKRTYGYTLNEVSSLFASLECSTKFIDVED